jgi:EAL domain-containing protein (putative c-di-GMP-specific phosphodiesterase class I)
MRHLKSCQESGLEPGDTKRFVLEIAEQVRCGIYESPQPLTQLNDDGCKRLLDAVCVSAQRMSRLQQWHQEYVRACQDNQMRAYALRLILDAVSAAGATFSLFALSLSEQVNRINGLVAEYVQQTGRKDNPRWYASAAKRSRKPSKEFNKYAY